MIRQGTTGYTESDCLQQGDYSTGGMGLQLIRIHLEIWKCMRAGVSLSTVTRSGVSVEPEGERADALRRWWESDGRTAPTQHLGEGLASAKCAPLGNRSPV